MDIYKIEIGKRLKQCRKERNLTQEQLSEMLGISQKHYSEAERGITGLSVKQFIKISDTLSISLDYLLKGCTPADPLASSYNDLHEINRLYAMSSESTRQSMLQLIQIAYNIESFHSSQNKNNENKTNTSPKASNH